MAEKDATEKILEYYNDVFCDIVNVLLFQGKEFLSENDIENTSSKSCYKADGKIHELDRDIAKYFKKGKIIISTIGIENQTKPDSNMPLRVIGYDGSAYRAQLLNNSSSNKSCRPYPVITIVLYFGYKHRWNRNLSLKERILIPKELEPYVNDYKINLFQIAYLTREQVALFKSDFRIIADYLVHKREHHEACIKAKKLGTAPPSAKYTPPAIPIKHVHETLQLLSVLTGDNRFEEAYNNITKGGTHTMCEFLDFVENRGINKGRIEGEIKGELKGENNTALLMKHLFDQNRIDDAKLAASDDNYRHKLMKELLIY